MSCVVCGQSPTDRCHIRSKGAGGPMEEWNLYLACRKHHRLQHRLGWGWFLEKHPVVWEHLEKKGWEKKVVLGLLKLWHPNCEVKSADK